MNDSLVRDDAIAHNKSNLCPGHLLKYERSLWGQQITCSGQSVFLIIHCYRSSSGFIWRLKNGLFSFQFGYTRFRSYKAAQIGIPSLKNVPSLSFIGHLIHEKSLLLLHNYLLTYFSSQPFLFELWKNILYIAWQRFWSYWIGLMKADKMGNSTREANDHSLTTQSKAGVCVTWLNQNYCFRRFLCDRLEDENCEARARMMSDGHVNNYGHDYTTHAPLNLRLSILKK